MCPPNEDPIVPDPKLANQNPPNPQGDAEDDENEEGKDGVPSAAFNRVKNDLFEEKKKRKTLEDQLNTQKNKELQDQNRWKEYAQTKDEENTKLRADLEQIKARRLENAKSDSVAKAAAVLGLKPESMKYLEMEEFKDVLVEETSTGRLIVHGAKAAAEKFKVNNPILFSDPRAPNVNGKDPKVIQSADGKVTIEELNKLRDEAKKTGNYDVYKQKLLLFKTQSK